MRAKLLIAVSTIALSTLAIGGCAAPTDSTTGPDTGTPALVDFTAPSVTIAGIALQEPVSVLVRDARGAVISASSIIWSSDNVNVVDVSGSGTTGTLTARGPGTATVHAKAGSASSDVTVRVLAVRAVRIAQSTVTLRAGDNVTFSAAVDGDAGAVSTVRWSVADPAIASISAQGVLTAIGVGTTTVTASANGDLRVTGTAAVTVTPGRAVVMAPAALTLWAGDTSTVRGEPELDASQVRDLRWASANPSIASVNAAGLVTAVGVGTTTLTATAIADPRVTGTATIRILPARSVAISPATTNVVIGESRTLAAVVTIEAGLGTAVTWRSSNASVVSVSAAGAVTGVALGTATITAVSVTDTVRRATASVTVNPVVHGVSLPQTSLTINAGERAPITATVDAEGTLSRAVTWRSSTPTVATVSASGEVIGVAAGTGTITAVSVADTTKRASLALTVRPAPAISVYPAQLTVATGEAQVLVATVNVEQGQSNAVMWRSSNSAVATISQSGLMTAVSVGTATITAISMQDTLRRATSAISVIPIVRSISVSPTTGNLFIGQSTTLAAAVVADAGLSSAVTWRSSNPVVATVSTNGAVAAVSIGSATITAISAADTTKRATASIAVASRPVGITLTPTSLSLNLGATGQLQALVTGDPGITTNVTWNSSNPSVATVSSSGSITAIAQGATNITATAVADPSRSAIATVVVAGRLATSWAATRASGELFEDVLSITSYSTSSAFAVNLVGDVYRWNGTAWTQSARGSTYGTKFTAVHGSSASNVIAVGTGGKIARFDGASWSAMTSGTANTLLSVFVEGSGNAYTAGAGGTILRLSGSTWSAVNSGSTQTLNGVWSNGGTAIAVGSAGEVLRLAGSTWSRQTVPTSETMYSVAGLSATNVVAVGTFGTVLRFDGTTWTRVPSNGVVSDLYSVDGSVANNGRMYIASDVGLLQLDGTALTATATPYRPRMFSVSVDGTGAAWVGGQRGAVIRGSPNAFTTISLSPDLLDVWSTSATNAWAVGEFGFIYRYLNGTWTRQTSPTTATLNSVWASSATDAFAAGDNGIVLHWDGSSWTSVTLPTFNSVYALWGSSATNVFAVTSGGRVFRYNGSSWTQTTAVSSALWAVFGTSANDVYVSGEGGTLLRFNGSTWTAQSPSSSATLAGLWANASTNVLTVGADGSGASGVAYRYDGNSWQPQSVGTNRALTSAWGASANDVYATGDQGTILRYNGTSWSLMPTGTTDLLWSLTGSPTGTGGAFAVGYNSSIVVGTNSGSVVASALRMGGTGSLEPSAQAMRDPRGIGPLPSGKARRNRKQR